MRVDVAGVGAAFGQDVDPEPVAFQLLVAQIEAQLLAEGGDVLVQRLFQIAEDRHPPGQVIQRGIGGVAGIAVRLAPLLPGLVIPGHHVAGLVQFGVVDFLLRKVIETGAVKAGDEEGGDVGHGGLQI